MGFKARNKKDRTEPQAFSREAVAAAFENIPDTSAGGLLLWEGEEIVDIDSTIDELLSATTKPQLEELLPPYGDPENEVWVDQSAIVAAAVCESLGNERPLAASAEDLRVTGFMALVGDLRVAGRVTVESGATLVVAGSLQAAHCIVEASEDKPGVLVIGDAVDIAGLFQVAGQATIAEQVSAEATLIGPETAKLHVAGDLAARLFVEYEATRSFVLGESNVNAVIVETLAGFEDRSQQVEHQKLLALARPEVRGGIRGQRGPRLARNLAKLLLDHGFFLDRD